MSTTKKNTTKSARQTATEAIAEAREILTRRQQEHAAAVEAHEELTARLHSGDESVTPAAMTEAAAAVERAEILVKAGEQAHLTAVKKAEVTDWTSVAGLVADAIRPALPGIPVEVINTKPDRSKHNGQPVIYVHQSHATKPAKTGGGSLSAAVNVELHTAAPLSVSADVLGKAVKADPQIAAAEVNGSDQVAPMPGGGYVSVVGVSVQRGWESTPFIPTEPTDYHARLAATDATTALRSKLHDIRAGGALDSRGELVKSATVDGQRHTLVRLALGLKSTASARPYTSPIEALTAGLVDLESQYADGLGRCTAIKVEGQQVEVTGQDNRHSTAWVTAQVEYLAAVA
ncbi:hypothetical protein ACL02O_14770 [Micromonospora sp. MS34]|uniref:hypothetical protein n=1 Tax=Micromonospora sp. MS34 TaxID=3385971 RepID=UPI0039A067BD